MRTLLLATLCCCACVRADIIVPQGFRAVTFASGLDFPTGVAQLGDGSFLVAETVPTVSVNNYTNYFWGSGELVHFTDANHDGVADGAGTVVASGLGAAITKIQTLDNGITMVATAGNTTASGLQKVDLVFLNSSYSEVGRIDFQGGPTDILPTAFKTGSGAWNVVVGIAASTNDGTPGGNINATGLISATVADGSIISIPITTTGGTVSASSPAVLGTGIRNTSELVMTSNGDVYFGDNGYEIGSTLVSTDELNIIPGGTFGSFYGYPGNYTAYGTGQFVGGAGTQAYVAFQQLNGVDSLGISGLGLTPGDFPAAYQGGMFASFGGNFNYGGTANVTDPLVFISSSGAVTHFIEAGEAGWGTVATLLSTDNALYVPVMFTDPSHPWLAGTGVIYGIMATPEPGTFAGFPLFCLVVLRLRRRSSQV